MPFSNRYLCSSRLGIPLSWDSQVLVSIIGNVDGITLGIDVGTDLVYLYVSLNGYNDGKF